MCSSWCWRLCREQRLLSKQLLSSHLGDSVSLRPRSTQIGRSARQGCQGSCTAPPQTSQAASGRWLLSTAGTTNSLPLVMEYNQQCLEPVRKGTTARSLVGEVRSEARKKQHRSTLQQVPVHLHKTDNGAAGAREALPYSTDPGELTASLSAPSSGNGSAERLSTLSQVTQLLTLGALISATDYSHISSTPKTHHTTVLTRPSPHVPQLPIPP